MVATIIDVHAASCSSSSKSDAARRHPRPEEARHVQALAAPGVSRAQWHVRHQVVVVLQLPVLGVKNVSR